MNQTIQPQALYQFTGYQLQQLVNDLVKEIMSKGPSIGKPQEMCTRQVKQHLLEKGYRVTSAPAMAQITEKLGLTRVKKGKEYWYQTTEVEAIPPRNISK